MPGQYNIIAGQCQDNIGQYNTIPGQWQDNIKQYKKIKYKI